MLQIDCEYTYTCHMFFVKWLVCVLSHVICKILSPVRNTLCVCVPLGVLAVKFGGSVGIGSAEGGRRECLGAQIVK